MLDGESGAWANLCFESGGYRHFEAAGDEGDVAGLEGERISDGGVEVESGSVFGLVLGEGNFGVDTFELEGRFSGRLWNLLRIHGEVIVGEDARMWQER